MPLDPANGLPPIAERFQAVAALGQELGSIDAIPEDTLAELGYRRLGLGHILPIEKVDLLSTDEQWEKKCADTPFERLEFSVPAVRGTRVSSITALALRNQLARYFVEEHVANPDLDQLPGFIDAVKWLPSDSSLKFFWTDFLNYLDGQPKPPEPIWNDLVTVPGWLIGSWTDRILDEQDIPLNRPEEVMGQAEICIGEAYHRHSSQRTVVISGWP